MTTDNRTNEPTEAQIEAAARVIWEMDSTTIGVEPPESLEEGESETVRYLELTHAALDTAQEAAPQAESDERIQAWERLIQHPVWRSCFEEERPLIDSMMERIDNLAELEMTVNELAPAPVLSSSGVDEEALAEVIGRDENYEREVDSGAWMLDPSKAARAVAEWLKGQGNAARE